ncbi:sigma-70 family RNA polymerase sigma factor [Neisseriaceae bacterium JH1-16]|nr:sigma-70 family RNA polymerase sigma factor [Neisseriaceae bacterium JH1-16]
MLTPEMIEAERPYLMRYALAQLRDKGAADEAVQETLLAALESAGSFSGKSSVRTWLTSILRFKLIDTIRREKKEVLVESFDDEVSDDEFADLFFAQDGHWREPVRSWGAPEATLIAREFWDVFERCSQAMPRRTAMAFVLRELQGMDIAEICKALDVTATNCSVMLYRARMSLRECFEIGWLGGAKA